MGLAAVIIFAKLHLIPAAGIYRIDLATAEWFASIRTEPLTQFFLLITQFGATQVVLVIALIALCFFLVRMRTYALPFFLALVGNALTVALVKESIARARPSADLAVYLENLFSFPSGHSAIAVVAYGFIAYALARRARGMMRTLVIPVLATLLIALIGVSRLYLGVHYLSDVIGGFLFGGVWLWAAILLRKGDYRP